MPDRRCNDIVISVGLVKRVADKDCLTMLSMFFMSHRRAAFSVMRPGGPFQARMDAAMQRLCDLGCVERVERGQFRIIEKEIRALDEALLPAAAISPTWGHA